MVLKKEQIARESIEEALAESKRQGETLRKDAEHAAQQCIELEERCNELDQILAVSTGKLEAVESSLHLAEERLKDAEQAIQGKEAQLDECNATIFEQTKEIELLCSTLAETKAEMKRLSQTQVTLGAEKDAMQAELADCKAHLLSARESCKWEEDDQRNQDHARACRLISSLALCKVCCI